MQLSQGSDYDISMMSKDELKITIGWAELEGWNPGINDSDIFYETDPQGFLVGKLNQDLIASISAVRYGNTFGFIGFYIVHPAFRGQGYGIQIWQRALHYLKNCTIGLDGVVTQQENYKKSGFQLAHRNIRFAGTAQPQGIMDAEIVNLADLSFDQVSTYDQMFFPATRDRFLKLWIEQCRSFALGIMQDGNLRGYGVIRPCHTGYKIGPLNAETQAQAIALFDALVAKVPIGSEVYLDIPEPNAEAIALAEMYGMQPAFETARMYRGRSPELPLGQIFGITSFELG
jgi:GNAT superfamily N-acetyltransferase